MMKQITLLIYCFFLILCLTSCGQHAVPPALRQAEACLLRNPDSTRLLLKQISYDALPKGEPRICYQWLQGNLSLGCSKLKPAQQHFLEALRMSGETAEFRLEGNICLKLATLYCIQDLLPEAERYARRSLVIFEYAGDSVRIASAYRILGAISSLHHDQADMLASYKKASEYARYSDKTLYNAIVTERDRLRTCFSIRESSDLEQLLLSSVQDTGRVSPNELSLGIPVYFQENYMEARNYLAKTILFPDYYKKIAAYNYLSTMELFEYHLPYTRLYRKEADSIYFAHQMASTSEVQYQYDRLSWENRNLRLQNQNVWKGIASLTCLILLIYLGMLYYFEQRKKRLKEQEVIRLLGEMTLSNNQIEGLRKEYLRTGEQNEELQSILNGEKSRYERLSVRLSELNGKFNTQAILNDRFRVENRRLKEAVSTLQPTGSEVDPATVASLGILLSFFQEPFLLRYATWSENSSTGGLLKLIEQLYGTTHDLKRFASPELKEKDRLLCYLHLIGVPHTRLALFFGTTSPTLSKYKQRLKARLGMDDLFHTT